MPSSYAAVLRTPLAARTFGAALVGRLSYGIVFLSLTLAVTRATGSYATAGFFVALFGLSSSVLSPLRALLIDRHGLRRALLPMAIGYAALLSAIAALTWRPGTPVTLLWALAVAAGALTPPLGPVMRALWTELIAGRDLRHRAFSLDTVAEELLYVTGPLLAGLLTALVNPSLGVAVSAALVLAGSLALSGAPLTARPARPGTASARPAAGLLLPILMSAAVGLCLGALGLLVVAFADQRGHLAAVAWIEAALAVGSAAGGLAYGAVTWRSPGRIRLPLLVGALGVLLAVSGAAADLVVLAATAALAGVVVAPALTTAYLLADERAAPDARTRAGAWVNTAFNLANAGGTAAIGLLLGHFPLSACFAMAAAPAILVSAIALIRRGRPGAFSRC
ncbi:MFS transporter [Actinoplanes sp. NPDC051494]|uniref:MFS transporter n=1 Tax=Actinoplanes sp. NPDC051494 TaxID=3363907 RepID=UPI0037BC76E0